MLHDRHKLDSIVAKSGNMRQRVLCKLFEGRDLWRLSGDADVSFIDERRHGLIGVKGLIMPFVRLFGIPDLPVKSKGVFILYHTLTVERYPVKGLILGFNMYFNP